MIIGVDVTCWSSERGYGRFTRELLSAMVELGTEDTFVLFADETTATDMELEHPNVEIVSVSGIVPPVRAAAADGSRSVADLLRMSRAVARRRLDVFFSPSVYSYFPLPPGLAAVVCIHDATVERYPELTVPNGRARAFWRLKVGLARRQARLILTVSDYAASELAAALNVGRARIRVALEAASDSFQPSETREQIDAAAARVGLAHDAPWFVYVGGLNPHKNVDLLIRAHGMLVAEAPAEAPQLLLVGPTERDVFHVDHEGIRKAIAEARIQELVRMPGFVPDDELRHLLSGALALVLPSLSEGFGLPAVEAAACGTPSVATTASPLPQLLDGGGVFVEPGDVDALADALRRMLRDEDRERMGLIARERAGRLDWASGARSALEALYEAAA